MVKLFPYLSIFDVHHLFGVEFNVKLGRLALLVALVLKPVVQVHQLVVVELHEVRFDRDRRATTCRVALFDQVIQLVDGAGREPW